jgi:SWI/SNF-related matrix-associated actin-dependent regulator 1 of chromatin subfamily A
MKHFPKAVKIDGSVSGVNRQKAVDSFQKDPNVQLMIANIKAGGVGLTLTAASNVAITQLPWSPSVLNQAIDRVHRITQVHQVTAWILVGQNTIEEKILSLLKEKESVVSEVLDGETYQDISVFMSLVNSYRKIKK